MDAQRWQAVKKILDAVIEVPVEAREAFLARSCGDDRELRWDVERLLALEDEAEDFIEEPVWNRTRTEDPGEESLSAKEQIFDAEQRSRGDRIGPYRIEGLLGQGGMGEVYLATREDDFEQRVAIKRMSADVVGRGRAGRAIRTRFLHERQILANLQHPMISRLLDGGATDDGQPYLVMEYVEGEPIDVYCQRNQLTIRQRVDLFRKVCEAVHYAHQNLIVHRDLKAGNILVTEEGIPRLLDFGIAKLLEPENVPGHFATVAGNAPMTPAYASPEQFLDEAITTACDIYALGVLLYKLLTEEMPYRVVGLGYAQLAKVICLDDPIRPSSRVARPRDVRADPGVQPEMVRSDAEPTRTIREQDGATTDPGGADGSSESSTLADPALEPPPATPPGPLRSRLLRRQLRGDLDAIVMKALRKEPRERYNSAALLSEDLQRYLEGLPVVARQGSWRYYTDKFIRRNKLAILVVFLVFLSAITSTFLWRRAEQDRRIAVAQRTRAERQQGRSERLVELMRDLFESADPERARGADLTVREVLERGRIEIDQNLADEPDLYAEMLGTLGTVYGSLGLYEQALEAKEAALSAARGVYRVGHPDHGELAKHLNNLAGELGKQDIERAERLLREAVAIRKELGDDPVELAMTMANLAAILQRRGEVAEAEELVVEALAIGEGQDLPNDLVSSWLYNLGAIHRRRGELEKAEDYLNEALGILEDSDARPRLEAQILGSLARVLHQQERFAESWTINERALTLRQAFQGGDHPEVVVAKIAFARRLVGHEESKELFCQLIAEVLAVSRVREGDPVAVAELERLGAACLP